MTKYEETEIYYDKIFEKLATMDESEMVQYLSKFDESAVIFSLKSQVSRIERAIKKQEKALNLIAANISKKDPSGGNAMAKEIRNEIAREKELLKKFRGSSEKSGDKTLARMRVIAKTVDEKSTLTGKADLSKQDSISAELSSKEFNKEAKNKIKNDGSNNSENVSDLLKDVEGK